MSGSCYKGSGCRSFFCSSEKLVSVERIASQSLLKIEMGEARLELPETVDMDAVAAILKSLQAVDHV